MKRTLIIFLAISFLLPVMINCQCYPIVISSHTGDSGIPVSVDSGYSVYIIPYPRSDSDAGFNLDAGTEDVRDSGSDSELYSGNTDSGEPEEDAGQDDSNWDHQTEEDDKDSDSDSENDEEDCIDEDDEEEEEDADSDDN